MVVIAALFRTLSVPPKLIAVALLLPIVAGAWYFSYRDNDAKENSRDHWVLNAKLHLLKIHRRGVSDFLSPSHPYHDGPPGSTPSFEGYVFALTEGAMRVGHDGWVYLKCHPSHDDDPRREDRGLPCIGDVCLAIDHKGRFYAHVGHVCGCLTLRAKSRKGFEDIQEFMHSRDPDSPGGHIPWTVVGKANTSLQADG